jgi:GT2 family glycosyltransferase
MASSVTVSFIVVNYNGNAWLRPCLDSIRSQTLDSFEVIVFDNGSSDGSADVVGSFGPRFRLVRASSNLGFAEANNRALSLATGPYVALLNNDAFLEPNWAELMVGALERRPDAGAAACRITQFHRSERIDSAGFAFFSCASVYAWTDLPSETIDAAKHAPIGPVASAALYRRTALDVVGAFHAEYFCYYEDTDLALRLVLHGFPTVYVHAALARHVGSHTGRQGSDFHVYHLRRNVEYVFWVDMIGHLVWLHLPWHLAFEALALAHAARHGQARVVLRAKRDAARKLPWILNERRGLAAALRERDRLRSGRRALRSSMHLGLPWQRLVIAAWRFEKVAARRGSGRTT